ncbi:hypothetical protein LZ30DRAFT_731014 [Colletotrichum cereale]|nr:hypothetical protein LZ30DRAFT_731014 [Colletotrichum cereale]
MTLLLVLGLTQHISTLYDVSHYPYQTQDHTLMIQNEWIGLCTFLQISLLTHSIGKSPTQGDYQEWAYPIDCQMILFSLRPDFALKTLFLEIFIRLQVLINV